MDFVATLFAVSFATACGKNLDNPKSIDTVSTVVKRPIAGSETSANAVAYRTWTAWQPPSMFQNTSAESPCMSSKRCQHALEPDMYATMD